MIGFLQYQFMQHALIGGMLVASLCAIMGTFLVPQRFSLLGDGLAHLAFGGIAIGLLVGVNPLLMAGIVAVLGALYLSYNKVHQKVYGDSAIAVLLTVGMAVAVLLIGMAGGFTVDLFSYLFGSVLTITRQELLIIAMVLLLVVAFVTKYYQQLSLYTFHQDLAKVAGINTGVFGSIFLSLAAVTTVLSIRVVGILLITALIVLPVITAMQLARSQKETLLFSVLTGNVAVLLGIILSFYLDLPSSALIVLVLATLYAVTTLLQSLYQRK